METGIIFGNKILDVVAVAWFIAQFYKVVSAIVSKKKFEIKRLWNTGGMPSSHSSAVSSLATAIGITQGLYTPLFAAVVVLAIIVMHDAAGIRRAAGQQAGVLNKITESLTSLFDERFSNKQLKELLGHTPVEVFVGAILGIAVALVMKGYLLM